MHIFMKWFVYWWASREVCTSCNYSQFIYHGNWSLNHVVEMKYLSFFLSIFLSFFLPFLFVWRLYLPIWERARERESKHEQGEGQRERDMQNPLWAGRPMQGSFSGPGGHDPCRSQTINQLNHRGALKITFNNW